MIAPAPTRQGFPSRAASSHAPQRWSIHSWLPRRPRAWQALACGAIMRRPHRVDLALSSGDVAGAGPAAHNRTLHIEAGLGRRSTSHMLFATSAHRACTLRASTRIEAVVRAGRRCWSQGGDERRRPPNRALLLSPQEEEPGAPPARSIRDERDHRAADRGVIAPASSRASPPAGVTPIATSDPLPRRPGWSTCLRWTWCAGTGVRGNPPSRCRSGRRARCSSPDLSLPAISSSVRPEVAPGARGSRPGCPPRGCRSVPPLKSPRHHADAALHSTRGQPGGTFAHAALRGSS